MKFDQEGNVTTFGKCLKCLQLFIPEYIYYYVFSVFFHLIYLTYVSGIAFYVFQVLEFDHDKSERKRSIIFNNLY